MAPSMPFVIHSVKMGRLSYDRLYTVLTLLIKFMEKKPKKKGKSRKKQDFPIFRSLASKIFPTFVSVVSLKHLSLVPHLHASPRSEDNKSEGVIALLDISYRPNEKFVNG